MLLILSGLPGVGKTAVARELARRLGAVHVRIDSIEQALRDCGAVTGPMDDAGYRIGYAVAEENLRLGHTVIADSVNPLQITRDAWVAVAARAHVTAAEIEITCTNQQRHRDRVETRVADIRGLTLPTWEEVRVREYEPWDREHIVIDTTAQSVTESVEEIQAALQQPSRWSKAR